MLTACKSGSTYKAMYDVIFFKVEASLSPNFLFGFSRHLLSPRGAGDSHMKGVGMLVRNFELNP